MTERKIALPNGVVIDQVRYEDVLKIWEVYVNLYIPTYLNVIPEYTAAALQEHIQNETLRTRLCDRNTQRIASPTSSILFVARSEGNIVGYAAADIDDDRKHWNSSLYVKRQGEGIGTELTTAM